MHGFQVSRSSLDHSTNFSRILAIDLGKFNSVLCDYVPITHRHSFETVQTTPQAMHDLLGAGCRRMRIDRRRWLCSRPAIARAGCTTFASRWAWRWRSPTRPTRRGSGERVKRKTDRDDAFKMVRMAVRNELPTVHMPDPTQRQRRRLIQHRRSIVQRRTMTKNGIRSIYSQQGLQLPAGTSAGRRSGSSRSPGGKAPGECQDVLQLWRGRLHIELQFLESLDTQLRVIDKRLDALADERMTLLQTVPGVGPRLAEAVVYHLDDPHRFKNGRQVTAYAGLVPKQFESGTMKRVGKITRRGPSPCAAC